VLVKLFVDRQLVVDASVVSFVAARIERSFEAAAAAVARLDREALSRGRRVTRPMAADILPQDGRGDEA
jgi:chromosomal replication initiation ATPase DnaA